MYVISYDIEINKIRNKIAKTLENYGKRVQYSVFECDLNQKRYEELYEKLSELMVGETEGNIRFYQICKNCEAKIVTMGMNRDDWSEAEKDLFII